jgi:hypothetical protein
MRRALRWVVGSGLALFAFIGVMHLGPMRALLAKASCPVGGDLNATPAQREATRRDALASRRGLVPAPAHSMFGFEFARDNTPEISSWVVEASARCKVEKAGLVRECDAASLSRFGVDAPGTVFFRADDAGRLVAMLLTVRLPDEEASVARLHWAEALAGALGLAHSERGKTTDALLSQHRSEHQFSDLLASVSATQMGDGVRVNLELQSL